MNRRSGYFQVALADNKYYSLSDGEAAPRPFDDLMSREELSALTGTMQPKRMSVWLESRGWVHEPPARRGDIPKVLRAYRDARLSGIQPERTKKANYSFMTAGSL
ncbi:MULTISPECIES: DUF4224 domain-containing protein [unclassified Hydrogenophaga]|uniref:DUF4224 domain-containing protein n=1 Tax=Pseudomonadota TaxID=1224 RepID=UPI00262A76B7|nr:DUF4224 domain-containing protein [Hydrogenophaga sp.]MCW5671182.1 DUF4224 domain-containing protein [Hydrogenophaga sp.]